MPDPPETLSCSYSCTPARSGSMLEMGGRTFVLIEKDKEFRHTARALSWTLTLVKDHPIVESQWDSP